MTSELSLKRVLNQPSVIKHNEVVDRMGVIPMTSDQSGPFGKVVYAGIQVFLHNSAPQERKVLTHQEDVGVYEIYFPLIGSFQVARGTEQYILHGGLSPKDTKSAEYVVTYDESTNVCSLVVRNEQKESPPIPGFVIPGGTDHSTRQVDNALATFLAIKIDSKQKI